MCKRVRGAFLWVVNGGLFFLNVSKLLRWFMRWKVLRLCLLEFFPIKNSRGHRWCCCFQCVFPKSDLEKGVRVGGSHKLHVSGERSHLFPSCFCWSNFSSWLCYLEGISVIPLCKYGDGLGESCRVISAPVHSTFPTSKWRHPHSRSLLRMETSSVHWKRASRSPAPRRSRSQIPAVWCVKVDQLLRAEAAQHRELTRRSECTLLTLFCSAFRWRPRRVLLRRRSKPAAEQRGGTSSLTHHSFHVRAAFNLAAKMHKQKTHLWVAAF